MKNTVVIFGMPGTGKGTQSSLLKEKCGFKVVSTGDMLRKVMGQSSDAGKNLKHVMASGGLVSDDLIRKVVEKYIKKYIDKGDKLLFDGFPRNISQAESLEQILEKKNRSLDVILNLDIKKSLLLDRISYRFSCSDCGAVYNEKLSPPVKVNICDCCGGSNFFKRDDDNIDCITKRLKTYEEQSFPVLGFYKEIGKKIYSIDSSMSVLEVFDKILNVLKV